jgi:hypothetical protein
VLYNLRILIESSFVVVFAIKLCYKLRLAFYKRTRLVCANLAYIALSAQGNSYISYSYKSRETYTRNKLKYILNNYFSL